MGIKIVKRKINKLNEYKSFDEYNRQSVDWGTTSEKRLSPLTLSIKQACKENLAYKNNTINLKSDRDFDSFFMNVKNAAKNVKEFYGNTLTCSMALTKCFNSLGIYNGSDFKEFLLDPVYNDIITKTAGVTFSFNKETRKRFNDGGTIDRVLGELQELGITFDTEGVNWEWGSSRGTREERKDPSFEDYHKVAPEGKQIWVIRSHAYLDGYPCLFLYPDEVYTDENGEAYTDENGKVKKINISNYSYSLDKFYMILGKDSGIIEQFYNPREFNLLWVACPCTYDHFIHNPIPTPKETADANERKTEEDDFNMSADEFTVESVSTKSISNDRKSLKRIVESYGKKDVINFVKHLNENSDEDLPIFFHFNLNEIEGYEDNVINNLSKKSGINISLAPQSDNEYTTTLVAEIHYENDFRQFVNAIASTARMSFDDAMREMRKILDGDDSVIPITLSIQNDKNDIKQLETWINYYYIDLL